MGAILSIYLLGLVLCIAAGVALAGLLDHRGRWVGFATIPLGLCVLVTLLYPLGALMPGSQAAPVALGIVAAALVAAAVLRLRAAAPGRRLAELVAALRPTWAEAAVLGAGAVAGLLILAPTIEQGFATTVAVSNNDGWGYATLVDWITDHPFPRDVAPNLAEPLSFVPWTTDRFNFGFGFERFASMLATLLGREGFEVVNSAAAVGLAAAVGGWAALAAVLRPRLSAPLTALVAVAVASPVLALPFIENYTTQFVSMCLWPFALAAFAAYAAAPGWRRLVVAAVAGGALVGIYPALAPWLVLPILLVAFVTVPVDLAWPAPALGRLTGPGWATRAGRGAAVLLAFAVAVAILSPIQVYRGVQNLLFLDDAVVNALGGFYSDEAYAALYLGAAPAFSILTAAPLGWPTYAALAIVAVAFAVALWPWGRLSSRRALVFGVGAAILITTGAILVRYGLQEELPYQVYKGLMAGGALLAGVAVIGLLPGRGSPGRAVRLVALGCLAAIWIPITSQNLEASVQRGTGFREPDVQMGRQLAALPPGSVVLVEGTGADANSFQYRMMAAYFGDRAPELTAVGLGTTASYLTPGGLPEWRPGRAWDYVLRSRVEPVATDRELLWANNYYALSRVPVLDVTTYGPGWFPPVADGDTATAQTTGEAELVVSNRDGEPRRARLSMEVVSYRRPRLLTLMTPAGTVTRRLPALAPTRVAVDLTVPADSTAPVQLAARPAAGSPRPGDGQPVVLRVGDVRVSEARG